MSIFTTIGTAFLPSSWPVYAGVLLIAVGGSGYLGWHERALREPAMLTGQKNADSKACKDAQDITTGENDALTNDRDRIAADAAKYKRLHPDACLYLSNDGKLFTGRDKHAAVHGISTDWLRDYAALCETYRSELMVCTGQ